MSGERYYYYLKLINSPADNSIDYFMDISQQLENDAGLDENEIISLENIINDAMARYNRVPVRVVNSVTGMEEEPPKTTVDDFGGNAIYLGIEKKYGIEWKVYEPKYDYSLLFKKWYYNENISKN
ncbi:hypothetical protein [Acidiplasma cupricumulans]|uniref:hypothetical protein n=1 Tax=Acidiplasma cupricumulans TaxID=312540 RepID=UPI000781AEEA|nr:hypothetical protein [Acidiplasma cupricumulans]